MDCVEDEANSLLLHECLLILLFVLVHHHLVQVSNFTLKLGHLAELLIK